jgi:hypothetical protein
MIDAKKQEAEKVALSCCNVKTLWSNSVNQVVAETLVNFQSDGLLMHPSEQIFFLYKHTNLECLYIILMSSKHLNAKPLK